MVGGWAACGGALTGRSRPAGARYGTVVIGAAASAHAPGIDVTHLAGQAGQALGGVTGGVGDGLLSAVFTPGRIGAALAAAAVPARAVRNTSAQLTAEVLLAAPFHRDKSMTAVWRAVTVRGRESDTGYDPPAKSSISDASHFLGVKVPAFLLAAVIGSPPPPGQPGPGGPPAGPRGMSGPVTCEDDSGWSGGLWHGHRVLVTDGTHSRSAGKRIPAPAGIISAQPGAAARWPRRSRSPTRGSYRRRGRPRQGRRIRSRTRLPPAAGLRARHSRARRPRLPLRQAAHGMHAAGADFVRRTSASWKLPRCGKPLPDGTYLTKITWHGETIKVRVVEFRIDFSTSLPAGSPLLTSPDADATITITGGAAPPGW